MKAARRALVVLSLAVAVIALALSWLATSDAALRWIAGELVARSEGRLVIDGLEGGLVGPMRAKRMSYVVAGAHVTATDVDLGWTPRSLIGRELHLARLAAAVVVIELPAGAGSTQAPDSLALPIAVTIDRVAVGSLELHSGTDVWQTGPLEFGYAGDAARHALTAFRAETPWGQLDGGVTIGARTPLPASGALALTGSARLFKAKITTSIGGNLAALELPLRADAEGAVVNAKVLLTPFEAVPWRELSARAEALDPSRFDAHIPGMRLDVTLDAAPGADGGIRGSVAADNTLPGTLDAQRLPVTRASAKFAIIDQQLVLTAVDAQIGRTGRVAGSGALTRAGSQWDLTIASLDLREVVSSLRSTALNGSVQGEFRDERQHWRGEVRDRRLALSFAADAQGAEIELRQFRLVAGAGSVQGNAQIALVADRRFRVDATATRIDPGYFGDYPSGMLSGTLAARGVLAPTWSVEAKLALAEGSRLRDAPLAGTIAMNLDSDHVSRVALQVASGSNRLAASGAFGRPGDVLQYTIEAGDLAAIAAVIPAYPLAGKLNARGSIAGTRARPAVSFHGTGDALHWGPTYRVGHVDADGEVDVRGASDTPLWINADARSLVLGKAAADRLTIHVDGTPARHDARLALRGGDVDLSAHLSGGLVGDGRDLQWHGRIVALDNTGRYPLALAGPADLSWHGSTVTLADARGSLAGGSFTLRDLSWDGARLSSSGEFSALPVAPILAVAGVGERVRSTLTVDGRWSLAAAPRLDGTVSIVRAGGDLVPADSPELALQLSRLELLAESVDDHVDVSVSARSRFGEIDASAQFIAAAHVNEPIAHAAPLSVSLRVDLASLKPLQSLFGTNAIIDGRLHADLGGSGTIDQVRLAGSIDADSLRIGAPQYGIALRDGVIRARLVDGGMILDRLGFKGGDGSFEASGTLPRYEGLATQASLSWKADHLQLLSRPDARLVFSGSGKFELADKRVRLDGELVSDEGRFEFRPSRPGALGDDVVVRGREPREASAPAPRLPFAVDLALDFGNRFSFTGNGLDVALTGRIRVTTDGIGPLAAKGTIDATRGSYTAFGQRLEIVRGRLIFDGPLDNPGIDVLALRRNLAVEAGVAVTGTVRVPLVQLTSNPPVPDNEKLSWLVLGHGVATGSNADQAALQLAMATLSDGQSPSQRFARSIGLDDISVRSADATRTGAAGQVVAASTRLTDRISLVYEQGLSLTNGAIKLEYALTPTITLRAEAGVVSGFGIYYSRSYN
jgi:translocation and assembly module TamB